VPHRPSSGFHSPYGFLDVGVSGCPLTVGDLVFLRRRYRDSYLVEDDAGRSAVVARDAVHVIIDTTDVGAG
jgi:hypothetical protein